MIACHVRILLCGFRIHIIYVQQDKFHVEGGLEKHRTSIMSKAQTTWNKWRGEMSQLHLKNVSTLDDAIAPDNIPKGLLKEDWEWLVMEHYTDPEFIVRTR